MLIYNITVTVEESIQDDWLGWMKNTHIPNMMATGFFLENRFAKVMFAREEGISYSVQFICPNMADLQAFQGQHAPSLQQAMKDAWGGKYITFTTVLELID